MRFQRLFLAIAAAFVGVLSSTLSPARGAVASADALPNGVGKAALFTVVNKTIFIYDSTMHGIAHIDAPYPAPYLALAPDGTLYAAYGYQALVQAFKPPYVSKAQEFRLSEPSIGPLAADGLTVDQRTGIIAITASTTGKFGFPVGVFFFRPGASKPCDLVRGDAVAGSFDSSGALFVISNSSSSVATVSGQCGAKTIEPLQFAGSGNYVHNLSVDTNDNLEIEQASPYIGISTYAHPVGGIVGKLLSQTPEYERCRFASFTSDGKNVWEACEGVSARYFVERPYQHGGPPIRTIDVGKGTPGFVAVFPPLVP